MDGIGKVHRRRPLGKRHDARLGRQHIDGLGEQVDLQVLQELGRIARFLLDVDERLQPHRRLLRAGVAGLGLLLVHPVRGNALLGHVVHHLRADLELDSRAHRVDQGGVQRLVAVRLGDGDVVLEAPWQRLVELMQHAQGPVAVQQLVRDDAKAEDVTDLREAQALFDHLVVDRENGLLPTIDLDLHPGGLEGLLHLALDAIHQIAAVAARALDRFRQHGVAPRVDVLKGQLLQLAVGLVQPQTVGDRHINVQRLAGDARALVRDHRIHRAHVVQAVGQLDQNDAHIPRHRQQHFAKRLGLVFFAGVKLQFVEFGQAIDDLGRGRPEALDQLDLGDATVLHGVVHERGHDGLRIKLHVRTQARHRNRVRDVGLTTGAELPQMRLVGEAVGVAHAADVRLVEVIELVGQGRERSCGCVGGQGHPQTLARIRAPLDGQC